MTHSEIIKSRIPMLDVLHRYGEEIRNRRCRCFIHNGENYNMSIRESSAHCFVCNTSADIFDYIMRKFNVQFPDAMAILNNDFSIGLDLSTKVKKEVIDKIESDRVLKFAIKRKYLKYKTDWLDGRRYEFQHFGKEPEGEPLSFDRWREVMGL